MLSSCIFIFKSLPLLPSEFGEQGQPDPAVHETDTQVCPVTCSSVTVFIMRSPSPLRFCKSACRLQLEGLIFKLVDASKSCVKVANLSFVQNF